MRTIVAARAVRAREVRKNCFEQVRVLLVRVVGGGEVLHRVAAVELSRSNHTFLGLRREEVPVRVELARQLSLFSRPRRGNRYRHDICSCSLQPTVPPPILF